MNLNKIDLNLLVVFDAIYTEKSISKAAKTIGLSQSAVSHALRRLRELLGDTLFIKSGYGVIPTERAEQIADPVRKSLRVLESTLSSQVPFDPQTHKRNFVIATSDLGEYVILPKLIGWLEKHAPNIRIQILPADVTTLADQLINGVTDLAIGYLPMLPETFRCQRIFSVDWVLAVRTAHPILLKGKLTADDLISYPHGTFTMRQGRNFKDMDKSLAEHSKTRHVTLEVPNFMTLPEVARHSNLIVALPRQLVPFAKSNDLVIFEPPTELESVDVSQFWHERYQSDTGHAWLRKVISNICSNTTPDE